jgi:hypothetical protein
VSLFNRCMTQFDFDLVGFRPAPSSLTGAPKHCFEKLVICLSIIILLCPLTAFGQQSAKKSKFEVETNWPGIHFRLDHIERILDERLLVVVRIVATAKAPGAGTLVGIKPTLPADGTRDDRQPPTYELRPFSLASSVMIDDLTAQRFPALPPIFPPGREYAPSEILAHFPPGRAEVLTLQFKVPPTALRADSASEKQTISLLLTNAKAPMMGVPVPSADAKAFSTAAPPGG